MAFIRKRLRIFRHKSLESTQNSVIFAQKTNKDKTALDKEIATASKKTTKEKAETTKDNKVVAKTTGKEKATNPKSVRKVKETTEKAPKIADKITGEYNGKKVYTGPRGGKYYINKNGNKTYIEE